MSEEPEPAPEPTREKLLRTDLRAQLEGDAERDIPSSRWKEPVDRMGRGTHEQTYGSGR